MNERIDAFIKENEQAIYNDIAKLIAQPSTRDSAVPGGPFGAGPRAALDIMLQRAEEMGFSCNDGDGYVGWAELFGEQEEHIATITHLDVVPEGEGWHASPFELRKKDGWIIGRGVSDDKGPSVLCLYAAKFLKDSGVPLRYGLRVLFGCDEESGMEDVKYYLENHPQPLFAFSPDADFPLCNGEKGMVSGDFVSQTLTGNIVQFECGLAPNVIPAKAECVVKGDIAAMPQAQGITLSEQDGCVCIKAEGIGGHAAKPKGTRNAIGMIVEYLLSNGICSESEDAFLRLLQKMHSAADGSGLGIACKDDMFDELTINGGKISLQNGIMTQSIDIRYPTATSGDKLKAVLAANAEQAGAEFSGGRVAEPFYIPPTSPPIKALLECYSEVTGNEGKPFTMGGGTYARKFKNAVSFGPAEQGEQLPDFVGPEHSPNEGANWQALMTALKIYILALVRLQEVEL